LASDSGAGASARAVSAGGEPDFKALFYNLPSPYMILDRDLVYVDANPAYCAVTEHSREQLIGRHIFDLFPNPNESGRRLRQSFERVFETGQPDSIPLIPYPMPRPQSRGGGFEMRYWSAAHVPLFDARGRTAFVVQNTVDVTELQRLKAMAYGPDSGDEIAPGEKDLLQRAREVEEANRMLQAETTGLRDLFMQAPGFMAVLSGPDLVFSLVNRTYQQLIGHRQVIGKTVLAALPEVRGQGFIELLRGVMRTGEPFIGQALSVMLEREPGAPLEERFLDFIYQPIRSASGVVWGVFVEGSDVTDRVLAERQQKLLVDELNHRVKNTLATVQAIASQTLRTNPEPAAFRQAFEARLIALSATHDLLTAANWRGAQLSDVVQLEFRPFGPERYRMQGPPVELPPAEALALGLLFHELATNAAKYGALSGEEGCVEVDWSVEGECPDRRLELLWAERGGPKVVAPTQRGFGSRLIERSLRAQMGGEAVLEFAETGLRCRVVLPLRAAP
jgi:PAS domain S-box-containing protein